MDTTFSSILSVVAALLTAATVHMSNRDEPSRWPLASVTLLALTPLVWLMVRVYSNGLSLVARLAAAS